MESNINHTTNQNTKQNRNRKHKSSCAMCLAQKRLPSLLAVAQQFRPGPSEGGDNWNFDSFWKHMVQSGAHRESVFFDATMQSHGVSSLSHLSIQLSQNAMHHFSQLLSIMCTTALSSPAPLTFIVDKHGSVWISWSRRCSSVRCGVASNGISGSDHANSSSDQ